MAGGKFSLANLFGMTIRESANDGSDFTNPDADYRRLFLGEDGLLHVKDSAGVVTSPYAGSTPVFVGAKIYSNTTQSIPDATVTAVTFNAEEFDTDGFHDNVTNNSRVTVPSGKAGKYLLQGAISFPASASPVVNQAVWRLNGSGTYVRPAATWLPSTAQTISTLPHTIVALAVGDYIELAIYQDSSGSRTIGSASVVENQSMMSITLLGT